MEIGASAVTGALRVGIQIVSSAKRPSVEVFQQVRNLLHPEQEYRVPGPGGIATEVIKDRRQEIAITLFAANIGAARAENLSFRIQPGLVKNHRQEFGQLFSSVFPAFGPGQVVQLVRFDEFDLWNYVPDGPSAFRPSELKTDFLPIIIEYDGPWSGWNRFVRLWSHLRRRRQYRYVYRFNPLTIATDYPLPESI